MNLKLLLPTIIVASSVTSTSVIAATDSVELNFAGTVNEVSCTFSPISDVDLGDLIVNLSTKTFVEAPNPAVFLMTYYCPAGTKISGYLSSDAGLDYNLDSASAQKTVILSSNNEMKGIGVSVALDENFSLLLSDNETVLEESVPDDNMTIVFYAKYVRSTSGENSWSTGDYTAAATLNLKIN